MKLIQFIILFFISLFALCTPLSYRVYDFHNTILLSILKTPLNALTNSLFSINSNAAMSSDSVALYLWVIILLLIAIAIGTTLYFKLPNYRSMIILWMERIIIYFLVLQLMRYGFDKVFKAQFYLPEPNILATELGQLDKDILFWSTMGTSYSYNVFLGLAEILAATLMLLRKTRVLGLLFALGITIHILAINFSFDISVKLFSSILFLSVLACLYSNFKVLYSFFIQGNTTRLHTKKESSQKGFKAVKALVVLIILVECILPFAKNGSWNDDLAKRPFLHGSYVNSNPDGVIKRIFVHRDGYLILENQAGIKRDYALQINEASKTLQITDYQLNSQKLPFEYKSSTKELSLTIENNKLDFKYSEWRNAPLLKTQYHWTVDGGF